MEHEDTQTALDDTIDRVEQVIDRESFLTFVEALRRDLEDAEAKERETPSSPYGSGWNDWKNMSLVSFLEAAVAWARDKPMPEEPAWQAFAHFLHAGKIYE